MRSEIASGISTHSGTTFRQPDSVHKSELQIRPVWHHREDLVQAHIFVCFLAYALWKTLEQWTRRADLGSCPRTVLDELAQVQSVDVVLPTRDGTKLRVRCVVKPEAAQAMLIERLGLDLPRRLQIPAPLEVASV
jgi:hypothetical protein